MIHDLGVLGKKEGNETDSSADSSPPGKPAPEYRRNRRTAIKRAETSRKERAPSEVRFVEKIL